MAKTTKKTADYKEKTLFFPALICGTLFGGLFLAVMHWGFKADWFDSGITAIFCFAMMWLFVHDLIKHKYSASWYPTIGMLGTFVGIFFGLRDLDISNIQTIVKELSGLLDGLKLAFITSIVGVALSCIRKFLDFTGINKIGTDAQEESVYESIVASADNTGQISAQITSLNDNISKLTKKLVNNVSDEFVAALGNVAKDLNDKLSEQFGENFRTFAGAVDKLVKWQETNKEHMDSYTKQLKDYAETYNKKLDLLTKAANGLDKTVEAAQKKIGEINTGLTTLSNLNTSATTAIETVGKLSTQIANIPITVSTQINTIVSGFERRVKTIKSEVGSVAGFLCGAIDQSAVKVYKEMDKYSETHANVVKLLNMAEIQAAAQKLVAESSAQTSNKRTKASRTKKED